MYCGCNILFIFSFTNATECARCHAGTRRRRRSDRHGLTIIVHSERCAKTRSTTERMIIIRSYFIISTIDPTHPCEPQINDSLLSLSRISSTFYLLLFIFINKYSSIETITIIWIIVWLFLLFTLTNQSICYLLNKYLF